MNLSYEMRTEKIHGTHLYLDISYLIWYMNVYIESSLVVQVWRIQWRQTRHAIASPSHDSLYTYTCCSFYFGVNWLHTQETVNIFFVKDISILKILILQPGSAPFKYCNPIAKPRVFCLSIQRQDTGDRFH